MAQAPATPKQPAGPKSKRLWKLLLFGVGGLFLALFAFAAVLPTLASSRVGAYAADWFGQRYEGRLEIAKADLAWFREQRIEGAVLRDPEAREVASVSATLPSLWALVNSNTTKLGKIRLALTGELVADDQGVTNLQRALREKARSAPEPKSSSSEPGQHPLDWLAQLDADIELVVEQLTWSDAETRRVGIPFQVRDLKARLAAAPGKPLTLSALGQVVSEQPGKLELDAALKGPIQKNLAWPFGQLDLNARVEGFSSAMVDGLANQGGRLVELLGARFNLSLSAAGATREQGDLKLTLDAPRASVALDARLEGGTLRSNGPLGLVATSPVPRGYLRAFVDPSLPPGAKLSIDAADAPWTIKAPNFALPLPPAGALSLAALRPVLEALQLELEVGLPGLIAYEDERTRTAGVTVGLSGLRFGARANPGQPLSADLSATLDSGAPGRIELDLTAHDVWEALSRSAVPKLDLMARVNGVSTLALGALAGQGDKLSRALGGSLELALDARGASLDAGDVTLRAKSERLALDAGARIADGVLHSVADQPLRVEWQTPVELLSAELAANLPPGAKLDFMVGATTLELREFAFPLPKSGVQLDAELARLAAGKLTLRSPGLRYADAALGAAPFDLSLLTLDLTLAAGGALDAKLGAAIDAGAPGKLLCDVALRDAWKFRSARSLAEFPPLDARLIVEGFASGALDALAGTGGRLARALGPRLSLSLEATDASVASGSLRLALDTQNVKSSVSARVDNGVLRSVGDEPLQVSGSFSAELLEELARPALPAGSSLWTNSSDNVLLAARASSFSARVPDAARGEAFDLRAFASSLQADLRVDLSALGWNDERTRAAGVAPKLRSLSVRAQPKPGEPLRVELTSKLDFAREADLAAELAVPGGLAALLDPSGVLPPLGGKFTLSALDTGALDRLLELDGLLASLFGPTLAVESSARDASSAGGVFQLGVTSEQGFVRANLALAQGVLQASSEPALEATLRVSPELFRARVAPLLPVGTRVELAGDAGPLTLRIDKLRCELPASGVEEFNVFALLAKLTAQADLTLPALSYADAKTDAAGRPVALREVKLGARFAPGSAPEASLAGTVVDDPPGAIAVTLRALDALDNAAKPGGLETFRVAAEVRATNVPTALVDVIAAQDGLLVDALGPRIELTVSAPDQSLARGAFRADLRSAQHSVVADARLEDGILVIERVDGVLAQVGLGPLVSRRLVGNLIPTLVAVQKPQGAESARFAVDALRLPLDGDLSKLDAIVRLDLGEIQGSVLPGLEGLLAAVAPEVSGMFATRLDPLTVPIKQGIATYDRLPLKLGGKELVLRGSFNLVTQVFVFDTSVPLKSLGKKVAGELDKLREFLSPELAVPLELRGTWDNPRLSISKKFLDDVLEDAAKRGLEKGLGDLLDGLGKKKKKKD